MTLEQILRACDKFKIHTKRVISDEYCELVIFNEELDGWSTVLTSILGAAEKPQGIEPSPRDLELTKASGGIRSGQTLFKKDVGDLTIIAKFWPWEDNIHTTLKMALLPS